MSFRVGIKVDADGKAAQSELKKTATAVDNVTQKATALGGAGSKAATGVNALSGSAGVAEKQVDALAASTALATSRTRQLGTAQKVSGAHTANVAAQINDIGVMLAAGQNPFQLAMQQGTQLNQVFAQMGGGTAALKGLGTAMLSMINPLSIMTLGVIAGGAALIQWTMSLVKAGDSAESFKERLDALSERVSSYKELADLAQLSTTKLAERFGVSSGEAQALAGYLRDFARYDAITELDGAVSALTERFGGLSRSALKVTSSGMMKEIEATFFDLRDELNLTDQQAAVVVRGLEGLATARTMSEKVAAAEQLNAAFLRIFGTVGDIPIALRAVAQEAGQLALQAAELNSDIKGVEAAYLRYFSSRIASEQQLANLRSQELASQAAIYQQFAAGRIESSQAATTAAEMLSSLRQQHTLQLIIAKHGADSAEATAYRALAERDAYSAQVESLGVAESQKRELMAAWDAAKGIELTNMASPIGSAADEAARLAANLQRAAMVNSRPGLTSDLADEDAAMGVPVAPNAASRSSNRSASVNLGKLTKPSSGGGGGSAANELERQRKAVENLITGLEDELAILRESDPIQKEMLRNREALQAATAAERDRVQDLITTRAREADAIDRAGEQAQAFRDTAYDALSQLRSNGEGLAGVFDTLASRIEDMVFQAALLGEGPLATLLGTAGGGGLIGSLVGALVPGSSTATAAAASPAMADGGYLTGRGGSRTDQIPMWGSSGEFMVNAKATRRHRHLLEALNSGGGVHFKNGGAIGPAPAASAQAGNVIIIENHTAATVTQSEESTNAQGQKQTRMVIAEAVGTALTTPGGGASRALRSMGVKPRGGLR